MPSPSSIDFITLAEARYLSLVAQRLEPMPGEILPPKLNKERLSQVIEQAGVIQLDSISVVSRAHETSLWSRVGRYNAAQYGALYYPDKQLFEYWAHAASLLPIAFFPFMRRQMHSYRNPEHRHWGTWVNENRPLITEVLTTIERDGPLSTRAFERPAEIERRPWDWYGAKPAKMALDYLWSSGQLVILRRVGFERVYDLAERVFPELVAQPLPSLEEQQAFFTTRALSAVGVGTAAWLSDFYRPGTSRYVDAKAMTAVLDEMIDTGAAHRVTIEGQNAAAWLDPALERALAAFRGGSVVPTARTLLCPFDNLLWRRERALALFGFDYLLESYVPEPKRIYGYHTLPILIDGKLVGRLDARYQRKARVLSVKALHLEPTVKPTTVMAGQILAILRRFTAFLGGGDVEVLVTVPEKLGHHLTKRLAVTELSPTKGPEIATEPT